MGILETGSVRSSVKRPGAGRVAKVDCQRGVTECAVMEIDTFWDVIEAAQAGAAATGEPFDEAAVKQLADRPQQERSSGGRLHGRPGRTASASSRRNAVTNLPKQRGLSPVNGAVQDDSDAVITTATARHHHRKARPLPLNKMGARDCTLRTPMPAQAAIPDSGWSAGPSSSPPSRTNSEPVAKDASWEVMKSNRRVMSEGSARRGMAKGSGE